MYKSDFMTSLSNIMSNVLVHRPMVLLRLTLVYQLGPPPPLFSSSDCLHTAPVRRRLGTLRATGPVAPVGGGVSPGLLPVTRRREGAGRPGGLQRHPGRPQL